MHSLEDPASRYGFTARVQARRPVPGIPEPQRACSRGRIVEGGFEARPTYQLRGLPRGLCITEHRGEQSTQFTLILAARMTFAQVSSSLLIRSAKSCGVLATGL